MKVKLIFFALIFSAFASFNTLAQPLVYSVENSGSSCSAATLPSVSQLPSISDLPDPFTWSNGSGRSTSFSDWACRRNEIKQQLEHYEIGTKPDGSTCNVSASYSGGTLNITVTANGNSMTMSCAVALPSGSGPFPAVIGMNGPSGSLPESIFSSRNVARITFSHDQVTTRGNPTNNDPFFRLYPNQNTTNTGQYAAWSWGISRIIDALEQTQGSLPIDLDHIAVTGCSYAGKMALFGGALDERVALTIAQESGGGGAAAWRVSKTLGEVETLCATDYRWFKDDMNTNFCGNEDKLPLDHHELMAMVAPRALLVIGNPDMIWLAEESGYVSCRAAHEVWKEFGIEDRFGFSFVGHGNHCTLPSSQYDEVEAFVDKFLLGNTSANTNVAIHSFGGVNYEQWYDDWLNLAGSTSANAGADQIVIDSDKNGSESVNLNGTGSSAADGTSISSYIWRENGSQIATGVSPTVSLSTGTHTITLTVTDSNGGTDTDDVEVTVIPGGVISVNVGGTATGTFLDDQYFSDGSTYTNSNSINTSQVGGDVPSDIFQTERYGDFTYTITGLDAGSQQTVTLYFAETYVSAAGERVFNVSANGTQVLSNYDIYASAGGADIAVTETFTTTASGSGNVVLTFSSVTENAKVCGISLEGSGSSDEPVTGVSLNTTQLNMLVGGSQTLTATIAPANATNKTVTWSTSNNSVATVSGGVVSAQSAGTATITVTTQDGGYTASCTVTVSEASSDVSVNVGGSATGSFLDDQYFSNGSTYTNSRTINTSQVSSDVPSSIFLTERYGDFIYTIPNLEAGSAQTVTLYFAETYVSAGGERVFNVSINGTQVLSNYDIYAAAGGADIAISETFNTTASNAGEVVISFSSVTENPKVCGITVVGGGSGDVPVTGVSISPTSMSLEVGETGVFNATVSPSNATNQSVSWVSSNTSVATVSSTGTVSAVGAGTAQITVTSNENSSISSSASVTVTNGSTGDYVITIAATGVVGDENLNLIVNGVTITNFTMSTSTFYYSASTNLNPSTVQLEFDNDGGDRDIQVDYIDVDGTIYQAEDQESNTAVYQDGSCGGSYSEMMHCAGTITFDLNSATQHTIEVVANGIVGDENLNLIIDGNTISSMTMSTSATTYTVTTDLAPSTIQLEFDNDGGDRDIQVDYITVDGTTYQAEDQESNTAVYQDGSCGGSYSEMMHCDGIITFDTNKSAKKPEAKAITVKGIDSDAMLLYPVPANNLLHVSLKEMPSTCCKVSIYNTTGKIVLKTEIGGTDNAIDISQLAKGVYILSSDIDGQVIHKRFIKK